jgi:hypothetical protein
MLMVGPVMGADGDSGVPTIDVKISTVGPLGGARAGDAGASTINAKTRQ